MEIQKKHSIDTICHHVDFCVIGGGLAGICAAIEAARHGSSVVLMQERPVLGGNASSEIRMWICGAHGENNRATGILEEIEMENYYRNPSKDYYIWNTVLLDFVKREKNITLLLNTSCFDAEMEGNTIKSVLGWQMTTQTFQKVIAKTFADCSGDSILAPLTGAAFRVGREAQSEYNEKVNNQEEDKKTMGMSCLMQIRRGYQSVQFIPPSWVTKVDAKQVKQRIPNIYSEWENFWTLELGGDRDSILDTEKLREELLSLSLGIWDYIKNSNEVPNADTLELAFLGFLPGKRESRRLMGPYVLTANDLERGTIFEDEVAFGGWGLDDHDPAGFYKKGTPNTNEMPKTPYSIPYRVLYSENITNLFFAGRNISTTHMALSSTRVMATCAVLGQAVGAAASLTKKYDTTPNDIYLSHMKELQAMLLIDGCFLPNIKREVSSLCKNAKLETKSQIDLENLRLGIDRTHKIYGEGEFGAWIPLGETISYTLKSKSHVKNIRIVFDSDLNRKTLPGSTCERLHSMRASVWPESPQTYVPKTLVKEYELKVFDEKDQLVFTKKETEQHLPLIILSIEKNIKRIELQVQKTWDCQAESYHLLSFDFQ